MKNLILLFVLCSSILVNGQKFDAKTSVGDLRSMDDFFNKRLVKINQEEIKGSEYLFSDWNNEGIIFSKGDAYKLSNINISLTSKELSSLKGENSVFIYDKAVIDSLIINKKKFIKYNGGDFYEVLFFGKKVTLLKEYDIKIIDGMFSPMDGTTTKSRFSSIENYFIKQGSSMSKFVLGKKSVLDLCKENEAKVKKFIKSNKLSLKKEEDVVKMLKYNDEL